MRANEFINESEVHDWHLDAIPGLRSLEMNQFYELYRFGLAMASHGGDNGNADKEGPFPATPATASYSDGDEKIIKAALKTVGKKAKNMSTKSSDEPPDTNHQSIVATRKPLPRRS
jgi:hypothetical protein